jgi:hypothetical protein
MVIANKSRGERLYLASALVATVLSVSTAAGATNFYPPCNNPQNGNCDMVDYGNQEVMLGGQPINQEGYEVALYFILYGGFTSAYDQALLRALSNLLATLNDSVYGAIATTYSGPSGTASGRLILKGTAQDTAEQFGADLYDNEVQQEISDQIVNGNLPIDPNGIYVVLADTGVSLSNGNNSYYCSNFCGYNKPAEIDNFYLHYAVVGNAQDCPLCQWGFPTPNNGGGIDNNGAIDKVLAAVLHEIYETITDPDGGSGGWQSSGTGPNGQMADFCVGQKGQTYALGAATGNYHTASGDFMLQPLRVNALFNGNYQGYCVNSYGGVFSGTSFGLQYTPTDSDWSPGNYKGECPPQEPMIGLSQYLNQVGSQFIPGSAHAVMCDTQASYQGFPQSTTTCSTLSVSGLGTFTCPSSTQYLAGLAQSSSGLITTLLCCATASSISLTSCSAQPFNSQALAASDTPYDWDWGFLKADCPMNQVMTGVTITEELANYTQIPYSIQCCYVE